jgi:hypothetical protein
MTGLTRKILKLVRQSLRLAGIKPADPLPCRDYYAIAIYQGSSPLDLQPAAGARTPVLTGADVNDLAAVYVADPFMIRCEGMWHMFFEILPEAVDKGVIGHASSADGLNWRYGQVVIEEDFHLSYPCVFESGGEIYMVPESHQDRTVRLYQAVDFPARWRHVCNLLEDCELVDCTPFFRDGRWWMFAGCGEPPLRADGLRLFHADALTGPWIEHPRSPVVSGNARIARPGGRVVEWEGRLLRFTQDCEPRYGLRVRAFEITELTTAEYAERPATFEPVLREQPGGKWNSSGMHHLDAHRLPDGSCLACVDGWKWAPIRAANTATSR